jgi:cell division protein FtsN
MEQKKLLWIIFSVTLFLVVVVGAGFIWFYPGDGPEYAAVGAETPSVDTKTEFDPIEWVRTSNEYPAFSDKAEQEKEDGFVVVYGEGSEEDKDQEEKGREVDTEPAVTPSPSVDEEEKEAVAAKPAAPKVEPKAPSGAKEYTGTKKTIRMTEYWIQAGSYTSEHRAEKVRSLLNEKGFAGRLETKEIDGTVYYRVRIGPYGNKAEADKFLSWVKGIKDFEKSYVSKVYRTKTVRE